MLVILYPVFIRENAVTNISPEFYDQKFFQLNFSENNHRKLFSKIAPLQSWSKNLKIKERKSSFVSIVAGLILKTLTIKLNSFTSVFFSRFLKTRAELQYSRSAFWRGSILKYIWE